MLIRLVRIEAILIGSLGETLLNKLWPTSVVGGVMGDLDDDESECQFMARRGMGTLTIERSPTIDSLRRYGSSPHLDRHIVTR